MKLRTTWQKTTNTKIKTISPITLHKNTRLSITNPTGSFVKSINKKDCNGNPTINKEVNKCELFFRLGTFIKNIPCMCIFLFKNARLYSGNECSSDFYNQQKICCHIRISSFKVGLVAVPSQMSTILKTTAVKKMLKYHLNILYI